MEIIYLGHSSFKIKGKTATVVIDPFSPAMVGFKYPKTEAEVVIISHQHKDHNFVAGIDNNPFEISMPGEYEIKGISFFCFPSFHDDKSKTGKPNNMISLIETDELRICHLGDLKVFPFAKIMEEIINVDVLMVPVGGVVTLDPKEAIEIINQIDPLIVIPMHYKTPGINEDIFGDLSTVEDFLAQSVAENVERLDKLSISKDKLPTERKTVILERKN